MSKVIKSFYYMAHKKKNFFFSSLSGQKLSLSKEDIHLFLNEQKTVTHTQTDTNANANEQKKIESAEEVAAEYCMHVFDIFKVLLVEKVDTHTTKAHTHTTCNI